MTAIRHQRYRAVRGSSNVQSNPFRLLKLLTRVALTVFCFATLASCGSAESGDVVAGQDNETTIGRKTEVSETSPADSEGYSAARAIDWARQIGIGAPLFDGTPVALDDAVRSAPFRTSGTVAKVMIGELAPGDLGVEYTGGGEDGTDGQALPPTLAELVIEGRDRNGNAVTVRYFLGQYPDDERAEKLVTLAPPTGTEFIAAGSAGPTQNKVAVDAGLVLRTSPDSTVIVSASGESLHIDRTDAFQEFQDAVAE